MGIRFEVDAPLAAITPKPLKTGDGGKRPAWQTALNVVALAGWLGVLLALLATWPQVDLT